MTDPNKPEAGTGEDDIYVIDDTGDLQEVQELAGYREAPVPVEDEGVAPAPAAQASGGDAALQDELRRMKDQFLRSRADFENFRKRAEREKNEYFRYAMADTLRDLLPVLDNFERALAHEGGTSEFRTGIEMIYRQFSDVLGRMGLEIVDPMGQAFDPQFHEAVMREENDSVPANTVTDVLQKGYLLRERLLRPAMVKVAVGGPDRPDDEAP